MDIGCSDLVGALHSREKYLCKPPLLLRIHYHDANGHHRTNYHRCMGTTLPKIPPTLLHTDSATGDLSALIRDVPRGPVTELLITTKFTAIYCNCSWEPPLLLRIHYHDANGHHRTKSQVHGYHTSKIPETLLIRIFCHQLFQRTVVTCPTWWP